VQELGVNTNFDIEVHVDTGGKKLGAFNMYLDFDATKITIDTSQVGPNEYNINGSVVTLGSDAIKGFGKGDDTQSYMMLTNSGDITNGHFRFAGIHAEGVAVESDVHLITIHASTTSGFIAGSSNLEVRVNELSNELGHALTIGTITNAMITSSGGLSTSIYRLYNKKTGTQLYARGQADRDKILNKYPDFEFTDGAPAFYASTSNDGNTPMYRLYNTRTGAQLYTKGEADRDKILNKWHDFEFTDGGPAFYAAMSPAVGLTPIFRLYNTRTGMHLYTKGIADREKILNKYSDFEFTDGGPAFYAQIN